MFDELFGFFKQALQDEINLAFVIPMLLLFFLDLGTLKFKKQHHVDFKGVISVIGILGTFVGVFIGLNRFDISIPTDSLTPASLTPLLDAIKIAFFTSLSGMTLSIILGVIHISVRSKKKGMQEFLAEEFAEIKRVLIEDLPQQIQQGAIEQIVAQLEIVVKDFNNKLKEQFGENFIKLNEACEKLLQWQKDHAGDLEKTRQSIEVSNDAINQSIQAIKECEKALSEFVEKYRKIQYIFEVLDDQTNNWVVVLSNLNLLVMNAQARIKEVSKEFKAVSDSLSGFAKGFNTDLVAITESMKTNVNDTQQLVKDQLVDVKQMQKSMKKALDDMNLGFANVTVELTGGYNDYKKAVESIFNLANKFDRQKNNDQDMSAKNE